MAEATHLIFVPGTNLKKFNQRIQQICSETPVTRITACLIKGGSVKLTLWTDDMIADEEDVAAGQIEDLKVGDPILEGDPVCALLTITSGETPEEAQKSEDRLEQLDEICASSIVEEINLVGQDYAWLQPRDPDGDIIDTETPLYLPVIISYTVLVFEIMTQAEDTGDDDEGDETPPEPPADDPNDPVGSDTSAAKPKSKGGKKKKSTKKKNKNEGKPAGDNE